jgi:hypothetical protein
MSHTAAMLEAAPSATRYDLGALSRCVEGEPSAGPSATGTESRQESYSRRAPTQVESYQPLRLEIFTTSPVCGEWMNDPPPT